MKIKIVSWIGIEYSKGIDWSIPRLMKSIDNRQVIITNGEHLSDTFTGTVLIKEDVWQVGHFSKSWVKSNFYPITKPLTIKFIP